MSPDEFAREMLNSFEAPVEGAFYTDALNALQTAGPRHQGSPDLNTSVITAWDLGMRHLQVVWLFQIAGRELHWIDYIEGTGKSLVPLYGPARHQGKTGGFSYRAHLLATRCRSARAEHGLSADATSFRASPGAGHHCPEP